MTMISISSKCVALPGRRSELASVFSQVAATRLDGREIYIVNVDGANDDVLWVYEVFRDAEALEAHRESNEVKIAVPASRELMVEPPETIYGRPVAGIVSLA